MSRKLYFGGKPRSRLGERPVTFNELGKLSSRGDGVNEDGILYIVDRVFGLFRKVRKGTKKMENPPRIISLVLKAVALGMAVVSIVLGVLPGVGDITTQVTLLSIGLFALAVEALQKEE
jgi:hypothetical protein